MGHAADVRKLGRLWLPIRVLVVACVAVFGGGRADADTPPSIFVIGKALDDLISLDPAEVFEFSGGELIANMYQRLFTPNPDDPGRPHGDLAESWSFADDGRTLTMTLRQDATFASGRPVTAADAAFSLRRAVILNKTPAFILSQLGLAPTNVADRVRALDLWRLAVTLDRAYAPSLVLNALSAGIASVVDQAEVMARAEDDDFGHGWLRRAHAGSGPFMLYRWQPGEYVIMDANPHHAGAPLRIRRVAIRDVREPATQRLLLARGDIDMARDLGPDQIIALTDVDGIVTWSAPGARLFYLGLNQRNPYLARPEVRQALRHLIDYQGIADALLPGRARVHQAFLPRGFLGAVTDQPFELDQARAAALLRAAGVADGFDITMNVRSDGLLLQVAQAIQATMAAAGVRIELLAGDAKQTLTRYRARHHDIYIGQWGPDYLDPHTNAAAFARNIDNGESSVERTLAWRNGWVIPELTAMTDAATLISDPQQRAAAYGALQRRVMADSPFIVMFQEDVLYAARANVHGYQSGLMSDQTRYRAVYKGPE